MANAKKSPSSTFLGISNRVPTFSDSANNKTTPPPFVQRFVSNKQIHALIENMQKTGELVYKPKDILTTIHPLNKLIRMMFVDQQITDRYLDNMHYTYASSLGCTPDQINSLRNNFKKNFVKDAPTFHHFEKVFTILKCVIIDFSATILLPTGETVVYQKTPYNLHTDKKIITVDDIAKMKLPSNDTPIFLPEDIYKTTHPISLFIHMYIIHQGITLSIFDNLHYTYCENLHYSANKINADRNNSITRFFKDNPTFKAWEKFNAIVGAVLLDLAVITKRNGYISVYKLSDAKKLAQQNMNLED